MALARLQAFSLILLLTRFILGCSSSQKSLPITGNPNPDQTYYSELLSLVEEEVAASPGDLGLRIKLAGYHETLNWPTAADRNIEAILRMSPKDPQVMVMVADYYIHRNDFERSWIYAQQADRLGSVHPSLSLIKSKYYYSKRDFEEASRYLKHYFDMGGKLPEGFMVASELELQKKDTLSALDILARGVEANPGHVGMTKLEVSLLSRQGRLSELADLIESYSRITNDRTTYRNVLLDAYFRSGDYTKASVLAVHWPESAENGLFQYASLLLESPMIDSAAWYADKMIAEDSLSVEARLLKGRYYSKRGRLGDAYNSYSAALALDSANQIATEERGIVLGKIAYLRNLKERQATMPVFDLTPKKSDNQ